MFLIGTIAGVAAGVSTYLYAKKRSKDNSTAAIAGGVTGTGTAVIVSMAWPLLLLGIPVAWWLSNAKKRQKALPPSR